MARVISFSLSAIETIGQALFDPYRPELHYMRGPGPKWREKQRLIAAFPGGSGTQFTR
jgi:hypothetical protein